MKLSKLLLAEDSPEQAELLIAILEEAGHIVVHKTMGSETLEAIKRETFDGILLDYMLPDMDGVELCTLIRKSLPRTPIILTTSYLGKITPEQAMEAGFNAFIPKPWSANAMKVVQQHVHSQSLFDAKALNAQTSMSDLR